MATVLSVAAEVTAETFGTAGAAASASSPAAGDGHLGVVSEVDGIRPPAPDSFDALAVEPGEAAEVAEALAAAEVLDAPEDLDAAEPEAGAADGLAGEGASLTGAGFVSPPDDSLRPFSLAPSGFGSAFFRTTVSG